MTTMIDFSLLIIILIPVLVSPGKLEYKYEELLRSDGICRRVTKKPFFKPELVIGKVWRVYYVWELIDNAMCIFVQFQSATRTVIHSIQQKMSDALGFQPNWNASGILMHMGRLQFDFLLLADDKVPGKYIGFPNLSRDQLRNRKTRIPLFTRRMKILHNGTYLLLSACESGVTILASHKDPAPTTEEIQRIVAPMNFGDGFETCQKIKIPNFDVPF